MAVREKIRTFLRGKTANGIDEPVFSAREAIAALYSASVAFQPSEKQISEDVARVTGDPGALGALAHRLRETAQRAVRQYRPLSDHSQYGELGLLLRELVTAGRSHGIIVDVGANSRNGSNSYDLLADFGWKGVLIEANPQLIEGLRSGFEGLDYALINCAVGLSPGRQTLHLGVNDQVSSLDPVLVQRWGERMGGIEVDVRRLDDILTEHQVPHDFDILSIDVEGLDAEILNDLVATTSYRPRWIVAEVTMPFHGSPTLADSQLSSLLVSQYELTSRTLSNLVLRRR